jgi:Fic family protein
MDGLKDVGHLRKKPAIIRDPQQKDHIVFMPPDVKDMKPMTAALCEFIHQSKEQIDSIILAGLFHRQSVIIHP